MKTLGLTGCLWPVGSGCTVFGVQGLEGCREHCRVGRGQGPVGQDFVDLENAVCCKKEGSVREE